MQGDRGGVVGEQGAVLTNVDAWAGRVRTPGCGRRGGTPNATVGGEPKRSAVSMTVALRLQDGYRTITWRLYDGVSRRDKPPP